MMSLLAAALLSFQEPAAQQLVEQFRSDQVEERDRASRDLKSAGESARPVLEKAARDADVEVARRAREILDFLDSEAAIAAFRALQADLDQAGSVRVKVVGSGERWTCLAAGATPFKYNTRFLLEHGKRATVEGTRWTSWAKDRPETFRLTFDEVPVPLTLGMAILHLENCSLQRTWSKSPPKEGVWSCRVSEFRGGADDLGRTLTWRVQWKDSVPVDVRVKLWLDVSTRRPLKRTVVTQVREGAGSGASVTETFEEFEKK
jgi:hypothetical protein